MNILLNIHQIDNNTMSDRIFFKIGGGGVVDEETGVCDKKIIFSCTDRSGNHITIELNLQMTNPTKCHWNGFEIIGNTAADGSGNGRANDDIHNTSVIITGFNNGLLAKTTLDLTEVYGVESVEKVTMCNFDIVV